ncbi:MAG: putative baseplate assembly protein [Catenulispora sp.]
MGLPAPDLDDRRFQDLVDDAKRMVQRRCPAWTDHNVSDPGVTLIETFAFMTDQLLYRLNRVPDRLYVKFLELIGVRLLPPRPAAVPVTFWLSAPATAPITIAPDTAVATVRTESDESVIFHTVDELPIVPCELRAVRAVQVGTGEPESADRTEEWTFGTAFPAFGAPPRPGDALYLGLSDPVPACAVRIDFRGEVEGVGVDPRDPPLVWEAWNGSGWEACERGADETGGLNRTGAVTVHVPASHAASLVDGVRAGWLRARLREVAEGEPRYSSPPIVRGLSACTIGATTGAVNAELVRDEIVGTCEGVPGQFFTLARGPVLGGAGAPVLTVGTDDGWQEWTQVSDFSASGPEDRHYTLEAATGTVAFGPAVRREDGTLRRHGATPPAGAVVRMAAYTVGGGQRGNVARGKIKTLKSSIPFVAGVENRHPARDGVDGETLAEAKTRAPILLRSRSRAVTAEDYQAITLERAPELARVRCVTAGDDGVDAGSVRVLVVPAVRAERGRIAFADLVLREETLARVRESLDEVRLIGTRVLVEPPTYRGVTVVAQLIARPRANKNRIEAEATDALYALLNPLTGGPDGTGWPFGRAVQSGEVFAALQRVRGVDVVEDVRLFSANPVTGERTEATGRLEIPANSLVFSYEHQVLVELPS